MKSLLSTALSLVKLAPQTRPKVGSATMTAEAIEHAMDVMASVEDPDIVLQKLGLTRKDLQRLETDDEIFQCLETRRDAVIATPWRIEPYESNHHEWLQKELARALPSALTGYWAAVPYGYSVVENVFRRQSVIDARYIGIESSIEKPIEWFAPRYDGRLITNIPTKSKAEGDVIYKYTLTQRNAKYTNPYGEALLSRAYWPWMFRSNGWRFWMARLNRFADPLLTASVDDPEAWVKAMKDLGYEALVGVNKDEKVTVVSSESKSDFASLEQSVTRRIQKLILGQTLTSDVGSSGSYAAAKVHNEVRSDKQNSDLRLLANSAQKLVNALWFINKLEGPPPTFHMANDSGLEKDRAERDGILAHAGILEFTEQYLQNKYDFEPGDFIIPAKPPASTAQLSTNYGSIALKARPTQRFTQDQQDVEELADAALSLAESPVTPGRLREIIAAAPDADTLIDMLHAEVLEAEPEAFQELVERALFAASVLGYVNAEQGRGL